MKSTEWNAKCAISLPFKALLTRKNKTKANLSWVYFKFWKIVKIVKNII